MWPLLLPFTLMLASALPFSGDFLLPIVFSKWCEYLSSCRFSTGKLLYGLDLVLIDGKNKKIVNYDCDAWSAEDWLEFSLHLSPSS